jgi:hypothetical protein
MLNVILIVDGGIGKNICATGVIPGIKAKYPESKLIVIAGYQDCFANNPNVFRTYNFSNVPFLIDDFVRDHESVVLKYEPYLHADYIHQKRHVTDCWADGLGVESKPPEIFLTKAEKKAAYDFVKAQKKPIFVLQTTGGIPSQKMYYRDIPIELAQELVNTLKNKYEILHFRYKDQPNLEGATACMYKLREIFALLPHSANSLVIDSFVQHAAAALNKSFNVVWGGTNPKVLGYDIHNNIVPETLCRQSYCHRPNSYLFDVSQSSRWECPDDEMCLNYSLETILEKIKEI